MTAFFDELVRRVRTLPGVQASAAATQFPPMVTFSSRVRVQGSQAASEGELPSANFTLTTPGLFDALGLRVRAGRALDERDRAGAPRVAVVNEAFVRRHLRTAFAARGSCCARRRQRRRNGPRSSASPPTFGAAASRAAGAEIYLPVGAAQRRLEPAVPHRPHGRRSACDAVGGAR